jgi:hypothetical protein
MLCVFVSMVVSEHVNSLSGTVSVLASEIRCYSEILL